MEAVRALTTESHDEEPFEEISSPVDTRCVICHSDCADGKCLSDGRVYHEACCSSLVKEIDSNRAGIAAQMQEIARLDSEIAVAQSLRYRLKSLIFGRSIDVEDLRRQVKLCQEAISQLNERKDGKQSQLDRLYDFWLTYPPDWEERVRAVRSGRRNCEKCGYPRGPRHVHHKTPISEGGSHKRENLLLLCERCHSRLHGGDIVKCCV